MMQALDLELAYPVPVWDALVSLPVNLTTAMVLVDSAHRGSATPTSWPREVLARLPRAIRSDLDRVEALLVHGIALREFLLRRLPADHPARDDWPALRDWLARVPSDALREVVDRGIVRGLAHGRGTSFAGSTPTLDDLRDGRRRLSAARALLARWGVTQPQSALELVREPDRLRAPLLAILEAIWENGFGQGWRSGRDALEASAARARAVPGRGEGALGVEDLVLRATGLQAAANIAGSLRHAERIVFAPCLHLGRYLSLHEIDETRYVLYAADVARQAAGSAEAALVQPHGPLDREALEAPLVALGDPTRLAILRLLAESGVRNAQQIGESLHVHLSTVSRNLAALEHAGLVQSRRESGLKRYGLARERVREVAGRLIEMLG